ncbi:precorrin-3B C(17)-methyltransferase [Corynebacterium glucuronolyticum]|uniref:precorrin-3B C(17)-methyltransferase n=1 Tax=Corynebacterium glucuronolyticum TaxID=39791 RepID=UPI003F6DC0E3
MNNTSSPVLIGVGVGPGDPQLLTLAAVDAISSADVVCYHAKPGGSSNARAIAEQFFTAGQIHELLEYPVTTGSHPDGYTAALAQFYSEASERLAAHLDAGRTVAVLAVGDPMLYSSYQHLSRLLADYPQRIIPGIPSVTAAADVLGTPLAEDEDVLSIIPATLSEDALHASLATCDTAVFMKLGRNFDKVKKVLTEQGLAERAYVAVRVGMDGQKVLPLTEANAEEIPYFAVAVVPTQLVDAPAPGSVTVVGLGPGAARWTTPEVSRALREATDIVGYTTYVKRVPERKGQVRHLSDNRVEAERSEHALQLAREGKRVVVVSSGDPGVFAMATAVLEVQHTRGYEDVSVRVLPGMTAAQAVASRVGAPLGHDFALISLSNRLKPWDQVVTRVRAVACADMAMAIYNPASKKRTWQVEEFKKILLEYRTPDTPVIVARAVGAPEEKVTVTTLGELDPQVVDMRTMLVIGASTSVSFTTVDGTRVYTSRYYGTPEWGEKPADFDVTKR